MAERISVAQGAGAGRGSIGRGARGRGGLPGRSDDKSKRGALLDLSKYLDQRVRVKFTGGREVTGVLKGYDPLLNLVMDSVIEDLADPAGDQQPSGTRTLGLVVLRGTSITVINPVDGFEEIANPFATA